jgi:hypothetical protein
LGAYRIPPETGFLIHLISSTILGYGGASRRRCGLLDLPAPDQKPKHEDQFPEERDKDESKMGVRIKVWTQAIDHPAPSIDYQQNPDYFGDVPRPANQVAQQTQMNSENHQAYGPIVSKRN